MALKPLREIKFYSPLKIIQIPEEDPIVLDTYSDDPAEIPSHCVMSAVGEINQAIRKYASPCEKRCGIMAYFDDSERLGKVYSIFPSVEKVGNDVMGVYTCQLNSTSKSSRYTQRRCHRLPERFVDVSRTLFF